MRWKRSFGELLDNPGILGTIREPGTGSSVSFDVFILSVHLPRSRNGFTCGSGQGSSESSLTALSLIARRGHSLSCVLQVPWQLGFSGSSLSFGEMRGRTQHMKVVFFPPSTLIDLNLILRSQC